MDWTQTPAGALDGAVKRFLTGLGDNADAWARQTNGNPEFAQAVVGDVLSRLSGGYQPSTSQKHARAVMGANFFGVEEAMKHFGVNPSKPQIAALAEIPFSEETLVACKDTYVLAAVFPLSLLDIRSKASSAKLFYKQDWYNREQFAKAKGEVGWRLVRKTPVADSTNKTWDEQQALLGKDEETPTAQVMVYTIVGHFLATGERLFEKVYVRCSDRDSDGGRVRVGSFDADGLYVHYYYWDGFRYDRLGLSSARK
jgi:hypothetical protein